MRERFIEYSLKWQKTERDSFDKTEFGNSFHRGGSNQERMRFFWRIQQIKAKTRESVNAPEHWFSKSLKPYLRNGTLFTHFAVLMKVVTVNKWLEIWSLPRPWQKIHIILTLNKLIKEQWALGPYGQGPVQSKNQCFIMG